MSLSISNEDLDAAIIEASRFLRSATALRDLRKANTEKRWAYDSKANADTFRKSMDLTRSLAAARRRK